MDVLLTDIKPPTIVLRPVRRQTPEFIEMVESAKKDGIFQPILVRPLHCIGCSQPECVGSSCSRKKKEHSYEPVDGNHRYESAKEAGLHEVPVAVREMSDRQVKVAQIKCQAIGPETRTFEYARRLKMLMEDGMSINDLSALIDKTPAWINKQIHLNRLCERAVKPVEDGLIPIKSALALANLPSELQPKFIDEAISLEPADFVPRAHTARRDYEAYLLKQKVQDDKEGVATPALRAVAKLRKEAVDPTHAAAVLKAAKAKTPLDGWEACMSWIFKLDPVTISNRKKRRSEKVKPHTNAEYRAMNREMIKKFVNPQSQTGDYRHGE